MDLASYWNTFSGQFKDWPAPAQEALRICFYGGASAVLEITADADDQTSELDRLHDEVAATAEAGMKAHAKKKRGG